MKKLSLILLALIAMGQTHGASYAGRAANAATAGAYWALTLLAQPIGLAYIIRAKDNTEQNADSLRQHYALRGEDFSDVESYARPFLTNLGLPKTRIVPFPLPTSCVLIHDIAIEDSSLRKAQRCLHGRWELICEQFKLEYMRNNMRTLSAGEKFTLNEVSAGEDGSVQYTPEVITHSAENTAHIEHRLHELNDELAWRNEGLEEFLGVLHHEANHLRHHDITLRLPLATAAAVAIPPLVGKALQVAGLVAPAASRTGRIMRGVLNLLVTAQLYNAASRVIEQQADDAISDVSIRRGYARDLRNECKKRDKQLGNNEIAIWFYDHTITHPRLESRIEKLEAPRTR